MPAVALVLAGIFGLSLHLLVQARSRDNSVRRARDMLRRANPPGESVDDISAREAEAQLEDCCAECERIVARYPRDEFALQVWGGALWSRARRSSGDAADRLLAQAEEKYVVAMDIKPDNVQITVNFFWVLWDRAALHPGLAGMRFLERIESECERLSVMYPEESGLLEFWANSLVSRGVRTSGPEADRLFAVAEKRLNAAAALHPEDSRIQVAMAATLWRRAGRHSGGEARDFLRRSLQCLDTAEAAKPGDVATLCARAWVLYSRAKLMPGEETDRLLAEAEQQFAVRETNAHTLLQGCGVVFWARSWSAEGAEATRLLTEARKKLTEAESREPGSAAYNLACVCAQLGDEGECRQWLEKSREPGILVSREQMANEQELGLVRELAWFREMLG